MTIDFLRLCLRFSVVQMLTANSTYNREHKCDDDDMNHITANDQEEFQPTVQNYTPRGVKAVNSIEKRSQMNSVLQSLATLYVLAFEVY